MALISSPARYVGAYEVRINRDDMGEYTTVVVHENGVPRPVELFRFKEGHPMNREGATDDQIVRYVIDSLKKDGIIARSDGRKSVKALRAKYRTK